MNIKTFAKKHKTELIIGGVTVVGIMATVILLKQKKNPVKDLDSICSAVV